MMNEYLCFRPLYLDFADCTNITKENISKINDIGYKRRWKLVVYNHYKSISDLNEFIKIYSQKELKNILSVGINIDFENISELLTTDSYIKKNLFFVLTLSDPSIINDVKLIDDIKHLALVNKIFFQNSDFESYHISVLKMREIVKNINQVMFESDYLDPMSDTGFVYMDIKKADLSKINEPHKYAISTSYSDDLKTCYIGIDQNLTDWELFRQKGIFYIISFLRKKGLTEQEIKECIYGKFFKFFRSI